MTSEGEGKQKSRLEKWREPKRFRPILTSADESPSPLFQALQLAQDAMPPDQCEGMMVSMVWSSKEIIFDASGPSAKFMFVLFTLNVKTGQFELGPSLSAQAGSDDDTEQSNFIREILAMALIENVPVYPNTQEDAQILARHQSWMVGVSVSKWLSLA